MDRPWYVHYDCGVPPTIDYPDISLPELFERTARRYPDRVATVFAGKKVRYAQLQRQIKAFASGLHTLGISPGERVALILPNTPQYVVAFFGALRAGAVVVPTNPLYRQHELEHQLADAGVSAVITLDELFGQVQAALPFTPVRAVILTSIREALPVRLRGLYAVKSRRMGVRKIPSGGVVHRFEELLEARGGYAAPLKTGGLAVLQYTGGTTGRAKGAMLSHRNLLASALQGYHWQGTPGEDEAAILCAAPFFHVYGMSIGMNLAVTAGATMLLVPRWNARDVARMAEKYHPQLFPGVPTMYVALAELPGFSAKQFGSLHVCISGAAPLPMEVQRRFGEVSGAKLVEGYGLTEASPVTHCNPVSGGRPGTIGVPFPDTDAMITDPVTWEPLPVGSIGEITVRGPQVMQGYWNQPEETAAVLRDGWLHTGDLGTMDEDGFFQVVERKKDLIISGGYNVYPREVEEVLYQHPDVREAAVVGIPSAYRGETVKAVVALREGASAGADEIIAFCRERLAPFKVPKVVEFADDLPKSLIGKILRRELREDAGGRSPIGIGEESAAS